MIKSIITTSLIATMPLMSVSFATNATPIQNKTFYNNDYVSNSIKSSKYEEDLVKMYLEANNPTLKNELLHEMDIINQQKMLPSLIEIIENPDENKQVKLAALNSIISMEIPESLNYIIYWSTKQPMSNIRKTITVLDAALQR